MIRFPVAVLALTALACPLAAEPISPIRTAALSAELFAAGVAADDPVLILAAARLRKSINPAEDAARAPDGASPDGSTSAGEAPLGWEEMADVAADLAADDAALLGLIEDLRVETTKGVITGPVYSIASLAGGRSDTYGGIDFKGGEYAEVYVEAKSSVDLNLTVTDSQGRLVCADTDSSHIAYCGWRPDSTGRFTLKVENKGGAGTGYALMTN